MPEKNWLTMLSYLNRCEIYTGVSVPNINAKLYQYYTNQTLKMVLSIFHNADKLLEHARDPDPVDSDTLCDAGWSSKNTSVKLIENTSVKLIAFWSVHCCWRVSKPFYIFLFETEKREVGGIRAWKSWNFPILLQTGLQSWIPKGFVHRPRSPWTDAYKETRG